MVDTYEKELKYTLVKEGGLTPKMHDIKHTFTQYMTFQELLQGNIGGGCSTIINLYSTSHDIFNVEWSGSSCLYCDFNFINV